MAQVLCPRNKTWLKAVMRVIPIELTKKLQPYVPCLTKEEKQELGLPVEEEIKEGE